VLAWLSDHLRGLLMSVLNLEYTSGKMKKDLNNRRVAIIYKYINSCINIIKDRSKLSTIHLNNYKVFKLN